MRAAKPRPIISYVMLIALVALLGCKESNRLPAMERVGDRSVQVGETLQLVIRAEDPDGDDLAFFIEGKPPGAQFYQSGATATFLWAPSITDAEVDGKAYLLTITVQDSEGAWVSQDVVITVYPQGGVPEFLNPPGYVLNLAETDYLTFRIEVKDDDTTAEDLSITLHRNVDGAIFRVEEPLDKTAVFYWEPSPEQLAERSVYSILLGATDGVHDEVLHEIALVLLNPESARDCPGQPPTLQHTPPSDQRGAAGYPVTLHAFDAESGLRFPTLFWAVGAFPDPSAFRPLAMSVDADDTTRFHATIPPLAAVDGADIVSYYFTASDNDDVAADRCDHSTRLPKQREFAFAGYPPGTAADLCLEDAFDEAGASNDTQESATSMSAGRLRGLRLCPGDVDWYATAVGPGVRATFTLHHVADHGELDLSVSDDGGLELGSFSRFGDRTVVAVAPVAQERVLFVHVVSSTGARLTYGLDVEISQTACKDDEREPDDAPDDATVVPTPGFSFRGGTVCAGDPDWFRVTADGGQHLAVTMDISPLDGDLDLAIVAADGESELARVERVGKNHEELSLNVDEPGTYYVLVYSPEGADGVYDLEIQLHDQVLSCQDDALAGFHTSEEALMLPESTFDELTLCPGRPDWFQIGLNGGETLHLVTLAGDESQSFSLFAYDPDGAELDSLDSQSGWAELQIPIGPRGDYRFQIQGAGNEAVPYSLEFWAEEPAGPCTEDRFAPNHALAQAAALPEKDGVLEHIYTTRLKLCAGQEDWYQFTPPPGSLVLVAVGYGPTGGALGLDVFFELNPTIPVASSADPNLGTQWVEFVSDAVGGTYSIRVSGPGVASQIYDLGVILD